MDNLTDYFARGDEFAKHVGIELLSVDKGSARAQMRVQDHHLNMAHVVHGGAIFTLADYVFAVASNSHGTLALAVQANINYLKAVRGGIIYAEAREVSLHRKLATYEIKVTDEPGELIATFQGIVYRKDQPLAI